MAGSENTGCGRFEQYKFHNDVIHKVSTLWNASIAIQISAISAVILVSPEYRPKWDQPGGSGHSYGAVTIWNALGRADLAKEKVSAKRRR